MKALDAAQTAEDAVARYDAALALLDKLVAGYPGSSYAVRVVSGEPIAGVTRQQLAESAVLIHLRWLRERWAEVFDATTVEDMQVRLDAVVQVMKVIAAKYPSADAAKRIAEGARVEGIDNELIEQTRRDVPALVRVHELRQRIEEAKQAPVAQAPAAYAAALKVLDEVATQYPDTTIAARIAADQEVAGVTRTTLMDEGAHAEAALLKALWAEAQAASEPQARVSAIDAGLATLQRLAERYPATSAGAAAARGEPVEGIDRSVLEQAKLDAPVMARVSELEQLLSQAGKADPSEAATLYEQAIALIDRLVVEHPATTVAVRIVADEPVAGFSRSDLKEAVVQARWRHILALHDEAQKADDPSRQLALADQAIAALDEMIAAHAEHEIVKRLAGGEAVDGLSRSELEQLKVDAAARAALGVVNQHLAEAEAAPNLQQTLAAYDAALAALKVVAEKHSDASFVGDGSLAAEIEAKKEDAQATPFVTAAVQKIVEAKNAGEPSASAQAFTEAKNILTKMTELYPHSSRTRAVTEGEGIEGFTLSTLEGAVAELKLVLSQADRAAIQDALNALGFDTGAADGVFGLTTRNAIAAWQASKGEKATGYLTAEERKSLVAEAARKPGDEFRDCNKCPLMVVVPAGSFMMGSTAAEQQWTVGQGAERSRVDMENPQHQVTIWKRFAVGKYEVTFDEWDACFEDDGCNRYKPSDEGWGRGRRPVINVSWNDAEGYVAWLGRTTGKPYRLLTEAEWEYAARAGTTSLYSWGDEITPQYANYGGSRGRTSEVGSYPANPWGLYDMHGNVWEWVEDCIYNRYVRAPVDGSAWTIGGCEGGRVGRGGGWNDSPWALRSAVRGWTGPTDRRGIYEGFRIARTLLASEPKGPSPRHAGEDQR